MIDTSTIRKKGLMRRLAESQHGSVLILVALGIGAIMSVTGLVFEISNYASAKSRFNNAVDQALLAAAAAHSDNPTEFATQYLRTNLNETAKNVALESFSVSVSNNNTIWRASAKGTLKATIGGIIGITQFTLLHDAEVQWDTSTVSEIVAMVDVSGTMCAHFVRNQQDNGKAAIDFVPDQTCQKLAMMKEGLSQITKIGVGYSVAADGKAAYKVGIMPFTYKIRVPNPSAVPPFMYKGEQDAGYGSDYYTYLGDAEADAGPLPSVVPLKAIATEGDKAALMESINNITSGNADEFKRPAWKRSALAAEMSGLMLDPRYNDIFGGEKPAEFGAPNTKKIVIMMTDSANIGCCYTNYPPGNFRGHYIYSYHPDHLQLVGDGGKAGVCKQLKDAGVEVYTVLLDVNRDDMDAGGEEIVNSFQQCATDPSHAFEIAYGDEAKLKEVYGVIGKALIKLRLTQ